MDNEFSYPTTFVCQFSRYRFKRLSFSVAPWGNIFKQNIDKIFKDLNNVFGITNDTLMVIMSLMRDHNTALR